MELNAADFAILAVVSLSCLLGLWRGLIKEVLFLASWVVVVLLVWLNIQNLAIMMEGYIEQPVLRLLAAFLVIFIGVMLLRLGLTKLLHSLLELAGLTLMDRLLGGVFGVARAALIVCVMLFLSGVFLDESLLERSELWSGSVLIPYGLALIEWSGSFFAQSLNGNVI